MNPGRRPDLDRGMTFTVTPEASAAIDRVDDLRPDSDVKGAAYIDVDDSAGTPWGLRVRVFGRTQQEADTLASRMAAAMNVAAERPATLAAVQAAVDAYAIAVDKRAFHDGYRSTKPDDGEFTARSLRLMEAEDHTRDRVFEAIKAHADGVRKRAAGGATDAAVQQERQKIAKAAKSIRAALKGF